MLSDPSVSVPVNGPVAVTTLAPNRIETGQDEEAKLNLFLYHVAPNLGWRNIGMPSRDQRGERLTNPPLALDLYYLLTAYGKSDFEMEIVLGYAMQLLHETPILTRETIRKSLAALGVTSPPLQVLATSELAEQVELIKLSPQPMSTEEISKLWTAFQANYRPSVAYHASAVLIEARRATRSALPVRERMIHVMPFRRPVIDAVSPQVITSGGTLTIQGHNLKGDITRVRFGTILVDPDTIGDRQIEVIVPPGLLAGVRTVQVIHELDLGTSSEPHRGFESNVVAFMLVPQITTPPPISVAQGATLSLSFAPPIGRTQRVTLLIGDQALTIPPRAPTDPDTADTLDFDIPLEFPTGEFLLRVRVDGAESLLTVDTDDQYTGPKVTIT
jgi:hypothetical protein